MTAKEYLTQARMLDFEITCKQEEINQLYLKATCVQAVVISERVQSSHENSSNQIIDKILDLQREINSEICKLIELKTEIRKKISAVDVTLFRVLLTDYYINGYTFEQIAEKLNYSWRQIMRMHGLALQDFRRCHNMS
ncbi:MAG: DUF1492 domain-containing protein [Acutalibacteraceae bacterium]